MVSHLKLEATSEWPNLLLESAGGTPGNSWQGCAARFFKSRPDFRPKNVIFHTHFQTWPLGRNYCIITQIRAQTKKFFKSISNWYIFFLSYSFGIEMIKTFIHSRSSLKNHIRFQTKMGKEYTRFQTKTAQKPYPMGRHIPIQLI